MKLQFHTLDVFTDRPFGGNPLAVVLDADVLSDAQMQMIAREFNLSETIFVRKPRDQANTASARIFMPKGEIPFAGHPTVGCAILLASQKYKDGCAFETTIRLEEVAGLVPVTVTRIGPVPRAMFTAPVVPFAVARPLPAVKDVAQALGLETSDVGFGNHAVGLFEGGPSFLYVPLASRTALAKARIIEPHWSSVTAATGNDYCYCYVRGGDRPGTSFRARLFAPASGVPEDPATGSATAILAGQLLGAEGLGEGTHDFDLEQGYEMGRPSDLHLEVDVAGGKLRSVRVAGQAVQISQGVLEF